MYSANNQREIKVIEPNDLKAVRPTIETLQDDGKISGWVRKAISDSYLKYYRYESFINFEKIGSGSFGTVYRAYNIQYRKYVVIKSLNTNDDFTSKQIANELQQRRQVDMHDNIIGFYGVTKNDEYMLVIEYADGGTLRQYLSNNFSKMDWNLKLKFAKQISSAVFCLHANNIIHRDLNSENIFIHSDNVKLGDFGLSRFTTSLSKAFGSVRYSDPEFLKDPGNYERKKTSDVYSVGVLMWEISSGRIPFQNSHGYTIIVEVVNGVREETIPGTPESYIDIYSECWQSDPTKRPEMSVVIRLLDQVDIHINDPTHVVGNALLSGLNNLIPNMNALKNSYKTTVDTFFKHC